jgi:hypothetical protein
MIKSGNVKNISGVGEFCYVFLFECFRKSGRVEKVKNAIVR